MATPDFLWVGNHPGIDLLNTRPILEGHEVELLGDLGRLLDWCDEARILRPELRRRLEAMPIGRQRRLAGWARNLREALRAVLVPPGVAVADAAPRLDALLTGTPCRLAVTFPERPALDVVTADAAGQLRLDLARAAIAAATDLDPDRVRRCANPACVLVFYDVSKGGQRRWCDMAGCGNRAKAASYQRRHGRTGRRPVAEPPFTTHQGLGATYRALE
jgi:predicted RNA-binding Zn ribbon-like protein